MIDLLREEEINRKKGGGKNSRTKLNNEINLRWVMPTEENKALREQRGKKSIKIAEGIPRKFWFVKYIIFLC